MPYKNESFKKEYWSRNKDRYNKRNLVKLGTTNFKQHMCKKSDGSPDFQAEMKAISKEKKRIKKQYGRPPWDSSWINYNREVEDNIYLEHKHGINFF